MHLCSGVDRAAAGKPTGTSADRRAGGHAAEPRDFAQLPPEGDWKPMRVLLAAKALEASAEASLVNPL